METPLTIYSFISIGVLVGVYALLITEKINKAAVTILGAVLLILLQVFRSSTMSSQDAAFQFISNNLDMLFFIIGMMLLVGVIGKSGFFEAIAIWIAKKTHGKPLNLLVALGYLMFITSIFVPNIPAIMMIMPVILILIREFKLPHLPFLFLTIVMANIAGAFTPISDPTTYYEAKTVGLGFFEVINNSGPIVLVLSVVAVVYTYLIFRKSISAVKIEESDLEGFNPAAAIKDSKRLRVGMPILLGTILLLMFKDTIVQKIGISLDNSTLVLAAAFGSLIIFNEHPGEALKRYVDWETIFFFMGLFIVVGALQQTHVVNALGHGLVALSHNNNTALQFLVTIGSALLSVFIDNVPYNITMIGALQSIAAVGGTGIAVYPLWWALNLGTSIGGVGSPIGAACNVVALGQAHKEGMVIKFAKYLAIGLPFVVISGLIAFLMVWVRY